WHMTFDHANLGAVQNFVPVPPDSPLNSKGDGTVVVQPKKGKHGKDHNPPTPNPFPTSPNPFPTSPNPFPTTNPFAAFAPAAGSGTRGAASRTASRTAPRAAAPVANQPAAASARRSRRR
ncbi:MAG TPA: hypothetical protein VKU39_03000, partial [Streptosporangiaceae bacterium]|nr:hypothetical protein [Streptosporangiaceae bacterium]